MLSASHPNAHLPPASRVRDLFTGLGLPFRALTLVFTTPRLLLLSLVCAAVTAAALIGLWAVLWPFSESLARDWLGDTAGWWRSAGRAVLAFVLFAAMYVTGALTVPMLLLAPLQDPLSEATEARLGSFTATPFSVGRLVSGAWTSIQHTVARLALMLVGFGVLLPLNLIPFVGSVLYAVLSSAWAMWWISAEYLSGPMARHLRPFKAVLAAMRARPWLSMGMGATLYVVLWVPVLNCFLVPLAVIAGTLLFRALEPVTAAGT